LSREIENEITAALEGLGLSVEYCSADSELVEYPEEDDENI
jgi:hypothetical protein